MTQMELDNRILDKRFFSTFLNKYTEFLVFGVFLIIAVLPSWSPLFKGKYPSHDTLTVFHFYSHFYSEIILNHEIPLWLPNSAYGMPSESYMLFSFGPFQYLTLAFGFIFNIKSTLLLFFSSLVLESLFLIYSSYIFLKHLLHNRLAILASTCCIGLLAQYDVQLYWNFKVLLPIPLCLYLIHRWYETLNPIFFLASITNLLVWSFGALPYVLPFQFYTLGCYWFILSAYGKKISDFTPSSLLSLIKVNLQNICKKPNLLIATPLMTVIGCSTIYIFYIKHLIKTQLGYSSFAGRNPDLTVSLGSYMHHGGFTSWHKIMEMLNGMPIFKGELLPFTGCVCIIFAIYGALTKPKSKAHIALIIATIFVITFSIEGLRVSRIMYHFPQMNLFRHIAYVITIGKLLTVMLAGFGIDAYINKKQLAKP